MKIIAFGASTSSHSINKTFATYVAGLFNEFEAEILDLNDYEVPLFSVDLEKTSGIPPGAIRWYEKMQESDLLIISLAEHNGSYTAAFKNLFDWTTRHVGNLWAEKNMFLLSTSPGKRGGKGVMDAALVRFPIHGANILDHFSLPSFHDLFTQDQGITDESLKSDLLTKIDRIKKEYGLAGS